MVVYQADGSRLWSRDVSPPDMQEGGFGFWVGDWTGDGRDNIFVNDKDVCLILDEENRVIESIPGHVVYVMDLIGDARVEAVMLDQIAPGMTIRIVENAAPGKASTVNHLGKRTTPPEMYNCTRY